MVEASQPRPSTTPEPRRTFADTLELGRLENRGNLPPQAWSAFAAGDARPEAAPSRHRPRACPPAIDAHAPKLGEVLKTPERIRQEKIERVYRVEVPSPCGRSIDLFA